MRNRIFVPLPVLVALVLSTIIGVIVLVAHSSGAATQPAASDRVQQNGWYTPAQAQHGQIIFNTYCAECHRPDLTGAMGPALIGKHFLSKWASLRDLYNFEHTNMPATAPGTIPKQKLTKITAYILSKNGFPSGSTPLTPGKGLDRPLKR
jgi:mono/diheme cytochrome c family protein